MLDGREMETVGSISRGKMIFFSLVNEVRQVGADFGIFLVGEDLPRLRSFKHYK